MGKYLDNTGLQVLWNKIKSVFLPKSGGTITGNLEVTETLSVGNCLIKNTSDKEVTIYNDLVVNNSIYSNFVNCNYSITCDGDIEANGSLYCSDSLWVDSIELCKIDNNILNIGGYSSVDTRMTGKLYIGKDYNYYFEPVNSTSLRLNGASLIIGIASNNKNLTVFGNSTVYGNNTVSGNSTVNGDTTINGTLYVDNIKGNSENNTNLTLGTGDNTGYVYITDDMFGKNENGGQSWSIGANSGNAIFSSVSQSSDQRLKENIQDVNDDFSEKYWATENGLIHEYDWIKSKKHATGMIAQELLNYIPEAVNYNVEADSYSVDYTSATCKIMGAMFKKIKSLENEIITMKQEIEKLKNKQL